ncbi:hypothetical protein TBLA_0B03800 [Henningerozyma blattae CBS 6284]|uniref:Uncharacterized protein n=1 Tax=Henningerozyma blattae (strain ATCC 34711 / CBS 6284 / DSM 70876 / NBRC 10599 / NRRL Y-10934 / UCD 77-7) TaxID=1071380 RepID=I2GYL7_HENB6|nr:hypothetical protein TBLA_0B03800 [Tetrapisispora blattae CBS 6284]CCH59219.1 hypothetical protein TBLA_0B03800 [Tetrapisispora blattae CBS 6284]
MWKNRCLLSNTKNFYQPSRVSRFKSNLIQLRNESSFNYLNTRSVVEKSTIKQSKRKLKNASYNNTSNTNEVVVGNNDTTTSTLPNINELASTDSSTFSEQINVNNTISNDTIPQQTSPTTTNIPTNTIQDSQILSHSNILKTSSTNNIPKIKNPNVQKIKPIDYSWLPKVPTLKNLKQRDVMTNVLYSGYRPLSIDFKALNDPTNIYDPYSSPNGSSTLYEFAMQLQSLSEIFPWMSSAAGLEVYSEWDSIPIEVLKKLKPLQSPQMIKLSKNQFSNDIDDEDTLLKKISQNLINSKINDSVNPKKGRKRPIVTLLQKKKKLES